MVFKDIDAYTNDPLYKQALLDFQTGKWEEGLSGLADVEKKYPLEIELRALRLEMQVRARIDDYEIEETKTRKTQRWRRIGIRVGLVALVVVLVFAAVATYSGWMQQQLQSAQNTFNSQVRQTELAVQFINAQQLLQAGQTSQALLILEQIAQADPNYPGLSEARAKAEAQQALEDQYRQAMEMLAAGNAQNALETLRVIDAQSPQFRDVSIQIQSLETQTELEGYAAQADLAVEEQRWEDAIAGYESIRLINPEFNSAHIESQLFQAYIQAAEAVLNEPVPSLEALQVADGYFSQALVLRPQDRDAISARTAVRSTIEERMVDGYIRDAQAALVENPDSLSALAVAENYFSLALGLRPNDPRVLIQFQLARDYLAAVESFASGDYDAVIDSLEYVVGQDPDYADGTARQTLYEAYVARGQAALAVGDYALAIWDFQSAALLAQQTPDILPVQFESQILIAEAQGLGGDFYEAVLLYQNALLESGLATAIVTNGGELATDLANAEYAASVGNYQQAFQLYRTLLRSRLEAYAATTVVVKSGDYITSLANEFNTTVSAILEANGLTNQDRLETDTELIIPILP